MNHNDYGGLHEDLKLTCAAIKRRDALRLAAGEMGALYLFGRAGALRGSDGGAQLAFPKGASDATGGYESSVRTMARVSLERDSVFRDGVARQMATMSGEVKSGFAARPTVAV